jgi:hypothetical protein
MKAARNLLECLWRVRTRATSFLFFASDPVSCVNDPCALLEMDYMGLIQTYRLWPHHGVRPGLFPSSPGQGPSWRTDRTHWRG